MYSAGRGSFQETIEFSCRRSILPFSINKNTLLHATVLDQLVIGIRNIVRAPEIIDVTVLTLNQSLLDLLSSLNIPLLTTNPGTRVKMAAVIPAVRTKWTRRM
jgi:hypothetical protein